MTSTVPFETISFTKLPLPMSGGVSATTGWNLLPAFTGGSGLVSTSSDMMTWLKFSMGLMPESPLNPILAPMQTASTSIMCGGGTLGIGWFLDAITAMNGDAAITPIPIVYKAGLITSSSFICFMQSPDPGTAPSPAGVFLLSNDAAYGGPGSLFTSGAACVLQLLLAMNGYPNATAVNLL